MPRNTFKCPECGGNYKYCKFQRALSKTKDVPENERIKVYICKGTHARHPHPPILIEVQAIRVKEGDNENAKKVLHTLKMRTVYIDTLFDYMEGWREFMQRKYGKPAIT